MDSNKREEILDNKFADELELDDLVRSIEYVYECIENQSTWKKIEGYMLYLKSALKEKAKDHDQYQKFYGNWSNKLGVVHSREPRQETFVKAIWDLIFAVEEAFLPSDTSVHSDIRTILDEVLDTAKECGTESRCFPINYLVHKLEIYSWSYGTNPETVQASLFSLGLPFKRLYSAYRRLTFVAEDPDDEELTSHYRKAFASLIQSFIRKYNVLKMDVSERQSILSLCKVDVQRSLDFMHENEDDFKPQLIERYKKLQYALENF